MKTEVKMSDFKFFQPFEIRWNDLDLLGHVNNVLYLDYFQTGRGKYLITASSSWDWNENMFVIANISCDYIKELRLDADNPHIAVRVAHIGTKSFQIQYAIVSDGKNDELIVHATGSSTQVMIDLETGRTTEIPDWLREEFTDYEHALEF